MITQLKMLQISSNILAIIIIFLRSFATLSLKAASFRRKEARSLVRLAEPIIVEGLFVLAQLGNSKGEDNASLTTRERVNIQIDSMTIRNKVCPVLLNAFSHLVA